MSAPTFVVLGGGPAGCAAALALRRSGTGTVVVVESGTYGAERIGESIPPATRRLFARLGLLEAFEREGHEPCYGSCSSWGGDVLGYNDFTVSPDGSGCHLDRRRFDAFLARCATEAGVHRGRDRCRCPAAEGVVRDRRHGWRGAARS
jgi:2-polyprenyl-6-methoxyphenol hydroxylase-like FAD-dependent oxidoreductase